MLSKVIIDVALLEYNEVFLVVRHPKKRAGRKKLQNTFLCFSNQCASSMCQIFLWIEIK